VADHLTDEEQLQQLKNWWKDNGTSLIAAILIGLTAYFGFQWWQNDQRQKAEQASALYTELLQTVEVQAGESLSEEKRSTAQYLTQQLQDEYASSQYAINANFLAAKIAVENQNLDAAETALTWIIDKADKSTIALAELRLARVYIARKKYDEALALLDTEKAASFASLTAELKGDVLTAQKDWAKARTAYQEAIDTLGETSSFRRRLLPIKLANLPAGEK
jgi:predicted negative regulator of RcsB-dependent stress response